MITKISGILLSVTISIIVISSSTTIIFQLSQPQQQKVQAQEQLIPYNSTGNNAGTNPGTMVSAIKLSNNPVIMAKDP